MPSHRRATCPICCLEFAVNVSGLLRRHNDDGIRCPGSRRRVADDIGPGPQRNPGFETRSDIQSMPNERRRAEAARRDVEYAGKLLASGALDDRATVVALARVTHPQLTWRQLGEMLGLTKDQAVCMFRRRCVEAGLR